MRAQLNQALEAIAALQNSQTPPAPPAPQPAATSTPPTPPTPPTTPTFPAAPTGNSSTTDHKARFMEIYKRNPYEAAEYLQKYPNEMAEAAKDLLVG